VNQISSNVSSIYAASHKISTPNSGSFCASGGIVDAPEGRDHYGPPSI
jgi:hypothetical protein